MRYLLTEFTYIGPDPADHPEDVELTVEDMWDVDAARYKPTAGSYGDYATDELGMYSSHAEALAVISARYPKGYRPVPPTQGDTLSGVSHRYYPGPAERWSDAAITDYIHNGYNDLIALVRVDTPDDALLALATEDECRVSQLNSVPVDCHAQVVRLYFQHRDDLREGVRNVALFAAGEQIK